MCICPVEEILLVPFLAPFIRPEHPSLSCSRLPATPSPLENRLCGWEPHCPGTPSKLYFLFYPHTSGHSQWLTDPGTQILKEEIPLFSLDHTMCQRYDIFISFFPLPSTASSLPQVSPERTPLRKSQALKPLLQALLLGTPPGRPGCLLSNHNTSSKCHSS